MKRLVLYMAHPVGGDVAANLDRAERWLSWLRNSFRETTFIAPWITAIRTGENDDDPAQREMGLIDDCAVVERCDGIVLCGARLSDGMRRELAHYVRNSATGERVYSLICDAPGEPPPDIGEMPLPFAEWAALFLDRGLALEVSK